MSILLLAIIYLIFISLGLPDSLLGSAWPSISQSMGINESLQGILSIVASFCTIISSFLTVKLIKKFKEKGIVALSIGLTCAGLLCVMASSNFFFLCLSMIPLGLGAGAIDSTLNNYVAINYKAIHLNWLHAFWGVGATLSPFLVSFFLTDINGWRTGAFVLAMIQCGILLITILTMNVWKVVEKEFSNRDNVQEKEVTTELGFFKTFTIRGIVFAIIAFFSYIAIEGLTGNWFASMIVFGLGGDEASAARWSSYFYFGIMIGRIVSGIVSLKISDKNMIRIGESILIVGVILLFMQFNIQLMPLAVVIIGLGCAPIYPAIIHATPSRFTSKLSQNVMSVQVGCAYIASFAVVPLFGVVGKYIDFRLLPVLLIIFLVVMVICNEITLIKTKDKSKLLKNSVTIKNN